MVVTATAAIAAVVFSAMALEPEDCAFWRRWLSMPQYACYRLAIAAVPFLLAVLGSMTFSHAASLRDQLLQGLGVAAATAAALRATSSRKYVRRLGAHRLDREASSALAWLYERCCLRLDKAAGRSVKREMSKFKKRGFERADELVALAEEVVGILNIERVEGRSKVDRTRAEEKCQLMRDDIGVVNDLLAEPSQRRAALFTLAERLGAELVARRWDRMAAHQTGGALAPVEQDEEAL